MLGTMGSDHSEKSLSRRNQGSGDPFKRIIRRITHSSESSFQNRSHTALVRRDREGAQDSTWPPGKVYPCQSLFTRFWSNILSPSSIKHNTVSSVFSVLPISIFSKAGYSTIDFAQAVHSSDSARPSSCHIPA